MNCQGCSSSGVGSGIKATIVKATLPWPELDTCMTLASSRWGEARRFSAYSNTSSKRLAFPARANPRSWGARLDNSTLGGSVYSVMVDNLISILSIICSSSARPDTIPIACA